MKNKKLWLIIGLIVIISIPVIYFGIKGQFQSSIISSNAKNGLWMQDQTTSSQLETNIDPASTSTIKIDVYAKTEFTNVKNISATTEFSDISKIDVNNVYFRPNTGYGMISQKLTISDKTTSGINLGPTTGFLPSTTPQKIGYLEITPKTGVTVGSSFTISFFSLNLRSDFNALLYASDSDATATYPSFSVKFTTPSAPTPAINTITKTGGSGLTNEDTNININGSNFNIKQVKISTTSTFSEVCSSTNINCKIVGTPNATDINLTINKPAGTYYFQITNNDDQLISSYSTKSITINAPAPSMTPGIYKFDTAITNKLSGLKLEILPIDTVAKLITVKMYLFQNTADSLSPDKAEININFNSTNLTAASSHTLNDGYVSYNVGLGDYDSPQVGLGNIMLYVQKSDGKFDTNEAGAYYIGDLKFTYNTATAFPQTITAKSVKFLSGMTNERIEQGVGTARYADLSISSPTTTLNPVATTGMADPIGATTATLKGTVNAKGNPTQTVTFEYSTSNTFTPLLTANANPATVSGSTDTPVTASVTGLTASTPYYVRVKSVNGTNSITGNVTNFTTSAPIIVNPTATTNNAGTITTTSAILNGTVNAKNNTNIPLVFKYWKNSDSTNILSANPNITTLSGNADTNVTATVSSLAPNTLYSFRIEAGTTQGNTLSFTTDSDTPSVTTVTPSNITTTGAILSATVNAKNDNTTVVFKLGTTAGVYTQTLTATSIASGNTNQSITYALTTLSPDTNYYVKAEGTNTHSKTGLGTEITFKTLAPGTVVVNPTAVTLDADSITTSGAQLEGTANAKNNANTPVSFKYWETEAPTVILVATPTTSTVSGSSDTPITATVNSLKPNTSYTYRLEVGGIQGTSKTFTTLSVKPTVSTDPATSISTTGAILNATVNPNYTNTNLIFRVGTSTGSLIQIYTGSTLISGSTGSSVTYALNTLTPSTIYYVMAESTNSKGMTSTGDTISFATFATGTIITPAKVMTQPAENITINSAVLKGLANVFGFSANVYFEYDALPASKCTDPSTGQTTCTIPQDVLNATALTKTSAGSPNIITGSGDTVISSTLTDLSPNTRYHYRLRTGSSTGATLSFITIANPISGTGTVTTTGTTLTPQEQLINTAKNILIDEAIKAAVIASGGKTNAEYIRSQLPTTGTLEEILQKIVDVTFAASGGTVSKVDILAAVNKAIADPKDKIINNAIKAAVDAAVKLTGANATKQKAIEDAVNKAVNDAKTAGKSLDEILKIIIDTVAQAAGLDAFSKNAMIDAVKAEVLLTADEIKDALHSAPTTTGTTITETGTTTNSLTCPPDCLETNWVPRDVDSSHFASDAIGYLVVRGILEGYSDGTFRPAAAINRAEFSKVINRGLLLNTTNTPVVSPFGDVGKDAWFYNNVNTLFQIGLVNGYPDGTYKPSKNIQRDEAAKIVSLGHAFMIAKRDPANIGKSDQDLLAIAENQISSRYDNWRQAHANYTYVTLADVSVNAWSAKYILYALENGFVTGRTVNGQRLFVPSDQIARGEVAVLVTRVLEALKMTYPSYKNEAGKIQIKYEE